jgi:Tol biopolymer transport system component
MKWVWMLTVAVMAMTLAGGAPAKAAFPGHNGKIAYAELVDSNPNDGITSGQSDIFTINPDGSGLTNLTNSPINEGAASWSADGQKLVFKISRVNASDIYTMDASGGNVTRVTTDDLSEFFPVWAPDGKRIAYGREATDSGINDDLFVVNADGTGATNLTAQNTGPDLNPSWSPDGTRIAFDSSPGLGPQDIYSMDPDGSGRVRLTSDAAFDIDPEWSPDGTKIVFVSGRDGDIEIYVMNADGSGQTNVSRTPGVDFEPTWSPDGTKIAFRSRRHGGHDEVYVMNADGSNPVRVTNTPLDVSAPSWQPIPPPRRGDFQNAAEFCRAERDFFGDDAFAGKYGSNGNAGNAFGKCVSGG